MKTGIYFCNCSGNISGKIDPEKLRLKLGSSDGQVYLKDISLMCSEDGKAEFEKDISETKPDRIVIAACSPRDHEDTFRSILSKTRINPYLMQMVNIREQVAWVTGDHGRALEKAARYIQASLKRVSLHEPLVQREIDINPDVLVIGAGPAGLKAALTIASSGRKVYVIEKSPAIGGRPVRYDEVFPKLECGSCMLEPLLDEVFHGEYARNIELSTMSAVEDVTGSYGNFIVKVRTNPRYINTDICIGCSECIEHCPLTKNDDPDCGSKNQAISLPFAGALPNVPFINENVCTRFKGEDCNLCKDACPVSEAVLYDDTLHIVEKKVGAIVVATGFGVYDCTTIKNLGYKTVPQVYTGPEFELLIATSGDQEKGIRVPDIEKLENIGIIHCVGSLDKQHKEYCSDICCLSALKFNHMITKRHPDARIFHFYKELVLPGKDAVTLYRQVKANPNTQFIRYRDISEFGYYFSETPEGEKCLGGIHYKDAAGEGGFERIDMLVLCPALVAPEGSAQLSDILEIDLDREGFFKELHDRLDPTRSTLKGVYLAGACQSPMDIQKATSQAMATAGHILSSLVPGRTLRIPPTTAFIDESRCSGCMVCIQVCPFKAISHVPDTDVARINDVLCQGCGTCVSACPVDIIKSNHFTSQEIFAEIEGVLE